MRKTILVGALAVVIAATGYIAVRTSTLGGMSEIRMTHIGVDYSVHHRTEDGNTVREEYIINSCYKIEQKTPALPIWRPIGVHCEGNQFEKLRRVQYVKP